MEEFIQLELKKWLKKLKKKLKMILREEGEQATFETGVHGLHPELLRLLGRLKL